MTRVRQALLATSLWLFSMLSSTHGLAEDNAVRSRPEPPANPQSPASTKATDAVVAPTGDPAAASDQAAALAFQKALSSYSDGDVEGAFRSMQQSYLLSGRPELLFNLAGLERELARCQAALRDYDGYLRNLPNGKFRSDAERASRELEQECPLEPAPNPEPAPSGPPVAARAPVPREAPPPLTVSTREASYWTAGRVLGWSAVGSGVISGGLALYFLNAAIADHDAAAKAATGFTTAPQDPPWLDEQEAQHRDLLTARVLGITAGALVAGGVVVLILSPKSESAHASAAVAAYPGYLGAACSGSF